MTNDQITGPCPECEKLRTKLAEAEARADSTAADDAFDAIAVLCGCPEWHYPGQIVRDVEMLKSRAEAAEKKLEIAINATAPQVDAMLAAKLEAAEAERDSLQMQVVSHQNRIAELESYNHGIAETQDRLQAEVGELRKCFADANHKQILAEAEVETLKTLCTGKHEAFDDCG